MFIYENRRYNLVETLNIFRKDSLRSDFISDYEYWNEDDNQSIYTQFIDNYIMSTSRIKQEDAIELSIRANIFKLEYLKHIESILLSRRHYWIKLLCLDWLWHFAEILPKKVFIEVNSCFLKKRSLNELIKVQIMLNLLYVYPEKKAVDNVLKVLKIALAPATFYRVKNSISDNKFPFNSSAMEEFKAALIEAISQSSVLATGQKDELISEL